jgi:transcriptional repressor NrdR
MRCQKCLYHYTSVIKTRHNDADNTIIRRRKCLSCKHLFTTHEKYKDIDGFARLPSK